MGLGLKQSIQALGFIFHLLEGGLLDGIAIGGWLYKKSEGGARGFLTCFGVLFEIVGTRKTWVERRGGGGKT